MSNGTIPAPLVRVRGPVSGAIIRLYLGMGGAIKRTLRLLYREVWSRHKILTQAKLGAIKMGGRGFPLDRRNRNSLMGPERVYPGHALTL